MAKIIIFGLLTLGIAGVGVWLGIKALKTLAKDEFKRARWLLLAGLVILMFLYPPYYNVADRFEIPTFVGYAWLWDIPDIPGSIIGWPLLLVQWLCVGLVSFILWFAYRHN